MTAITSSSETPIERFGHAHRHLVQAARRMPLSLWRIAARRSVRTPATIRVSNDLASSRIGNYPLPYA